MNTEQASIRYGRFGLRSFNELIILAMLWNETNTGVALTNQTAICSIGPRKGHAIKREAPWRSPHTLAERQDGAQNTVSKLRDRVPPGTLRIHGIEASFLSYFVCMIIFGGNCDDVDPHLTSHGNQHKWPH